MLTVERLRELLTYDPDTGHFIWRVRASLNIRVGARAGCRMTSGRWQIRIDRKNYYASRLAVLYMTGSWPVEQVDHINCDQSDNRWANLREATSFQNRGNMRKSKRNTSGFKGVRWHRIGRCWEAAIKIRGHSLHLGHFNDPAVAHAAYVAAAQKHFGEFARAQ